MELCPGTISAHFQPDRRGGRRSTYRIKFGTHVHGKITQNQPIQPIKNHSCDPSIIVDTQKLQLIAIKDLSVRRVSQTRLFNTI